MAEADDGTAPATEDDAAASADVEVAEDGAGTDTMAEADDGTAPATGEDAAASADVEVAEDGAGTDTMAEADDGTAPAAGDDAAATPEAGHRKTLPAPTQWRGSKTATRPLPRRMRRLPLTWR